MPARFVTTSLVTKRAGIAARFVTLVTNRAVVTKRAATWVTDTALIVILPLTMNEALKRLSSLPILMQNHSGGDSVAAGISVPASTCPETTRR